LSRTPNPKKIKPIFQSISSLAAPQALVFVQRVKWAIPAEPNNPKNPVFLRKELVGGMRP
jgi:hypothetical protein